MTSIPTTRCRSRAPRSLTNGQDPLVARNFPDGGEYAVERLGDDGHSRPPPDAPGCCLVDEAGRGHLPDIGLPADPLPYVSVRPHRLAAAIGQLECDRGDYIVKRCQADRGTVRVVRSVDVIGVYPPRPSAPGCSPSGSSMPAPAQSRPNAARMP
jgi:hypothetical protein